MILRTAEHTLRTLASQFKAVAVTGPRQTGKTTLTRYVFPDKPYVSLENPDERLFATDDPRGFLSRYPDGAVLDEVQRAPDLFSYLQQILDEKTKPGSFILTGSNNFLLQEGISQTLAGRVAYLTLLPFSATDGELDQEMTGETDEWILRGGYPPIYDQPVDHNQWLSQYIRTYVERDVRQIRNITNMSAFERFLRLAAGRVGSLLNKQSLAVESGVDNKTIDAWLGVLEHSYVTYRLQPYHKNFNKRVVKMPKLYFYDTGLACALLGIRDTGQIRNHPLRGALFENMVINEYVKWFHNRGREPDLYFWRDNTGHEIDLIQSEGDRLQATEIKASATPHRSFFKELHFWNKISHTKGGTVIYDGSQTQTYSDGTTIVPWRVVGVES